MGGQGKPATSSIAGGHLHVRPARAADAGLLADWAAAMALETERKELDAGTVLAGIAAGIADATKARYFVAMRDAGAAGRETLAMPVGCLMLTTEWSDWRNATWWWIQSVYVPPQHRRAGVFSALYRHVGAQAAADAGVCGLRLYVEEDNAPARDTYRALGMVDAGYRIFETRDP